MFADQNGVTCFVDQNGVACFTDQNGVELCCGLIVRLRHRKI